jgi:hypothetical protein
MDIKQLVELAKEIEITDPIDWGYLTIEEKHAYELMASSLLDILDGIPEDEKLTVCMAVSIKLLVENFVLNLKLENNNV